MLECTSQMDFGLAAFRAGEFGLAGLRFRKAAEVAPGQTRPYFLLGQAEFAMGNYRDAVSAIESGMKLDKHWPRTPVQPRLDLYKGRDAEYTEHMQRLADAMAAHPNHPSLMFLIAHQLWFDGRRQNAQVIFRQARPLTDNPAFIDTFLAVIP
jgi:tetratricopeptide (TPR) repeat protein